MSCQACLEPVCVAAELLVGGVREPPFGTAQRFLVPLAVGSLP